MPVREWLAPSRCAGPHPFSLMGLDVIGPWWIGGERGGEGKEEEKEIAGGEEGEEIAGDGHHLAAAGAAERDGDGGGEHLRDAAAGRAAGPPLQQLPGPAQPRRRRSKP